MLTLSAIFARLIKNPNTPVRFIVKLECETDTFYIGEKDELFGTAQVYGLLNDISPIDQSIDPFNKSFLLSDLSITINSQHYTNDGSNWLSLLDQIEGQDYFNYAATIYACAEGVTSLSDCLIVFKGWMQNIIVDSDTFIMPVQGYYKEMYNVIPAKTITAADYPDAPTVSIDKPVPVLYGSFGKDKEMKGRVAECRWIGPGLLAIADSEIGTISDVWLYDEKLRLFCKIDSSQYTTQVDVNGNTTIIFDDGIDDITVYAYISPNNFWAPASGNDFTMFNEDQVFPSLYDKDETTGVIAYIKSGAPHSVSCDLMFAELSSDYAIDLSTSNGVLCEYKHHSSENSGHIQVGLSLVAGTSSASHFIETEHGVDPENNPQSDYSSFDCTSAWTAGSASWASFKDTNTAYRPRINISWETQYNATDIWGLTLYELRIRLRLIVPQLNPSHRIFVSANGRLYGSWIDAEGRSNNYDEDDVIENPAFVIEDILRRDLSLTNINTANFDKVANILASGVLGSIDHKFAFSIQESIYVNELIAKMCVEGMVNFNYDSTGNCNLAAMQISFPDYTASDTLTGDMILRLTRQDFDRYWLINDVVINYDKDNINDEYAGSLISDNTTSISKYDIVGQLSLDSEFIKTDEAALNLAGHYIGCADPVITGYWCYFHSIIMVDLIGWENIDWEVGDIIEFEASIDAICLNKGATWAGVKGMITQKQASKDGLKFAFLELIED